jgi:tRNA (guanosine-2'-O-)-methyltransferase
MGVASRRRLGQVSRAMTVRPLRDLPIGPPLHLEQTGRALAVLGPFLLPERIARMERALDARTLHLTAILENLHDPHNIGACVRTLDALGLQSLHIVHPLADPLAPPPAPPTGHPGVPRRSRFKLGRDVTRGSERWLDLPRHTASESALSALKSSGYAIAVTDIHGDRPVHGPHDIPLDRPLAVVFGNEHDGVSEAAREAADYRLLLPMRGFVESLNVSVAFAMLMGRLRERVDVEVPHAVRALPAELRARLLDAWVSDDIPHLPAVVRELAARASR